MVRYTQDGIIRDLEAGRDVLIVAPWNREAERAFRRILDAVEHWQHTRRTHGNWQATHASGARLWARSARGKGLRGLTAEVVVMIDYRGMPDHARRDLIPTIPVGGEIMCLD